jgi:hypothetical protein
MLASALRAVMFTGVATYTACGRLGFDPPSPTSGSQDARPDDADSDADADAASAIVFDLEAETAQLTAAFAVVLDPAASAGAYVVDGNVEGLSGPGELVAEFTISTAAAYYLWGRTRKTTLSSDSFWLSIDGGTAHNFLLGCDLDGAWRWVHVPEVAFCPNTTALGFPLDAGVHTLRLTSREGQSVIDRFVITSDPGFVPLD